MSPHGEPSLSFTHDEARCGRFPHQTLRSPVLDPEAE
jgi:hypothetical protein